MRALNLIPWRAHARRQRLRFWLLLFVGSQLISLALGVRTGMARTIQLQHHWQNSNATLFAAMQMRLKTLTALHDRLRVQERVMHQRTARLEENQRWAQRLTRLANTIPERVWLKEMTFTERQLLLHGFATDAAALMLFQRDSWMGPDFRQPVPGAVNRAKDNQLTFTLAWQQEGDRETAH